MYTRSKFFGQAMRQARDTGVPIWAPGALWAAITHKHYMAMILYCTYALLSILCITISKKNSRYLDRKELGTNEVTGILGTSRRGNYQFFLLGMFTPSRSIKIPKIKGFG